MKTSIIITGSGINSKSTLLSACLTVDSEKESLNFGNYSVNFQTKKEAINALSKAYQELSADKEDWKASCASYCRGASLSYDAGNARIEMS